MTDARVPEAREKTALAEAAHEAEQDMDLFRRALRQKAAKRADRRCPAIDDLEDLVKRFSASLLEKLRAAEQKYGHGNAWLKDDWHESLLRQLSEHVQKGDPRDVAAYCAFAWHHGWSIAPHPEHRREGEAAALAMLREIQWGDNVLRESCCPVCHKLRFESAEQHAPDCRLAALIGASP